MLRVLQALCQSQVLAAGLAAFTLACGGGSGSPDGDLVRIVSHDELFRPVSAGVRLLEREPHVIGSLSYPLLMDNGLLLIADLVQADVKAFDVTGAFHSVIGRTGSGPGEYQLPASLSLTGDRVVVVDAGQNRLIHFLGEPPFTQVAMRSIPPLMFVKAALVIDDSSVVLGGNSPQFDGHGPYDLLLMAPLDSVAVRALQRPVQYRHAWSQNVANMRLAPSPSGIVAARNFDAVLYSLDSGLSVRDSFVLPDAVFARVVVPERGGQTGLREFIQSQEFLRRLVQIGDSVTVLEFSSWDAVDSTFVYAHAAVHWGSGRVWRSATCACVLAGAVGDTVGFVRGEVGDTLTLARTVLAW